MQQHPHFQMLMQSQKSQIGASDVSNLPIGNAEFGVGA
jgi:hypothetical protein